MFVLALITLSVVVNAQEQCGPSFTWTTRNGRIYLNGNIFALKGVSYFGFETETFAPHGLWSYSLNGILDFVKNNNFNAIRLPFSIQMVKENPSHPNVDCNSNPDICHLNALDLMGAFIDRCAQRGILVMLDGHVNTYNPFEIPPLWYDNGTYTEAYVLSAWDTLLNRFGSQWNLFAIDLKNEPHGVASWGRNQMWSDWNSAAERFITHLANANPNFKGLFFVEGVDSNVDSPNDNPYGCFWGENLMGVQRHPLRTGIHKLPLFTVTSYSRIIYSPHVYGPDIYNQPYFQAGNFPNNMPMIWDLHFGYITGLNANPLIVGEWGGHYRAGSSDETWANAFADYLRSRCLTDQFYWCLNPNGGDTGGLLLDDWTTPDLKKLALLQNVQPNPTVIRPPSLGTYCITPGNTPMCN